MSAEIWVDAEDALPRSGCCAKRLAFRWNSLGEDFMCTGCHVRYKREELDGVTGAAIERLFSLVAL